MKILRRSYLLLYPLLGLFVGGCIGYDMDDIWSGCIDGASLGALAAIWYWIKRAGRYGLRF